MKNQPTPTYKRRGVALMLVMITVLITGGMAIAYFGSRDNSISISQKHTKIDRSKNGS